LGVCSTRTGVLKPISTVSTFSTSVQLVERVDRVEVDTDNLNEGCILRPSKDKLIELEKRFTTAEIARQYSVVPSTVMRWHNYYGLEGYASGSRYSEQATFKKRQNNYVKWLAQCDEKFGSTFDYSQAKEKFKTQKNPKVIIRCTLHEHKFLKTPNGHILLKFGGCEHCEREAVIADNIEKAKLNFTTWFNDNLADCLEIVSNFKGMDEPLSFKCKIHGTTEAFWPVRLRHNSAWGCSQCSKAAASKGIRLNHDELLAELEPTLSDAITIDSIYFDEADRTTKIKLHCDLHGSQEPWTIASAKRSETKCRECSALKVGYASTKLKRLIESGERGDPCTLGVMEMTVLGIEAMKVGVTTRSLKKRYLWHLKTIFYATQLFEVDAYVLENRIKIEFSEFKDHRILGAGMRLGERWSGDTEFYAFDKQNQIIKYIKQFLEELPNNKIDYEAELGRMIVPISKPRDVSREKGVRQMPIAVVGIDANTNKVLHECESYKEAEALGYDNISLIVSGKRNHSLGVRWFNADEFDPNNIPPIEIPNAKPVYCIERKQHFRSTADAEVKLRELGFKVSASKITSVIKGNRKRAGGFTWRYSEKTTEEILNQPFYEP